MTVEPLRLLLDLQGCQGGSRHRGIGRYSLSLAKGLLRNAGSHEVWLLLNGLFHETIEPLRREFEGLIDPARILVFHAPGPVDEFKPENAWRQRTAELLREQFIADFAPHAVLVSSMVEGSMDDTVTSVGWVGGPHVVSSVLYDLIPLIDPERYIGWAPAHRWYMNKMDSLRRCELLLAISESAKLEAEEHLPADPARVVNISAAADEIFVSGQADAAAMAEVRERFRISKPYLMHSGNIEPRKNFQGLIRAYATLPTALRRQHQLVLVGKFSSQALEDLQSLAISCGLHGNEVVLTGHVTDDELMALYASCHLFVFPSLHEGFGLPALEAMHFGVPTIGSNTSSVPEVIGRADATFDPGSIPEMAALISRALTDKVFRKSLAEHARRHASTFSWDRCARTAWAALETAVQQQAAKPPPLPSAAARESMLWRQVAEASGPVTPSQQELLAAARCLVRNEAEALRARARAGADAALTWRVEGPFDSTYSLALVNRETARALDAFGHQVVLHSTEGPGDFAANPDFLAANPDLAELHARAVDHPPERCDVVSRLLYPPRVNDMAGRFNVLHPYAWEESGFPQDWVDQFNASLDGISCLSTHVQKVLLDNGVRVPLATAGCGVDHWERVVATTGQRCPGRRFRFLHVSSCFPRKGADVLLVAFGLAFSAHDDVSLLIKTFANPHNTIHQQLARCRADNPLFPDVHILEGDLSDADLKALYQDCHVLVAPSRAEGFGLPMAEAMLSGLPVITTAWGGQMDFCNEHNAWLVDYRFVPAESHFRLLASVWAEPDASSLAEAMRRANAASAQDRRARARHGREVLLEHYTWADVTARALDAVHGWRVLQSGPAAEPRIGWITTWNTKCGIASYARHIIEAGGQLPLRVLAPRQRGLLQRDEDFVNRCWVSSKQDNSFTDLSRAIDEAELDVLIVQFNYGFFNLRGLGEFLHQQADAGRSIIVTLHATADPPSLAEFDENWRLSSAISGLARCHRLLVHTLADLNRLRQAGLVDNVALYPHPLWDLPLTPRALAVTAGQLPLVATFGYCLPHKGLPELLQAVALLKRRGQAVRLLMLNAEYPDPISTNLVRELRDLIATLGLKDHVNFRSDFLPDAEAAALLAQAELLVFAYQDTQESASGAVRHGMATARPVMVTPVPIFDELGGAVFRAPGRDPKALAEGLATTLQAQREHDEQALAVAAQAAAWRAALDVGVLSGRLLNIARGLHLQRYQRGTLREVQLPASSRMLRSEVGQPALSHLRTRGKAGHLLFGPYLSLPPGRYVVALQWRGRVPDSAQATLRVVVEAGTQQLAERALPDTHDRVAEVELPFEVLQPCVDLEFQVRVDARIEASIVAIAVRPHALRAAITSVGGGSAGTAAHAIA